MIALENITVKFGKNKAVENFSFDFSDYDIVALCGPSGCGKTTILNVIAGLLKPSSGKVIGEYTPLYMFQQPRLFPHLNALENVNVVLEDNKSTVDQAKKMLEKVGFTDFDKYPDELSGGMKQRVALARTLAPKGDLLLLDEPFSALDTDSKAELLQIVKNDGRKVIFVTHDPEDAKIADYIINF